MELDESPDRTPTIRAVRLGSGTAFTLLAQVIILIFSFVTSILVARALGPSGKGQLTVIQQVPALLLVLLNLGLGAANTYRIGTGKQRTSTALGNSLLLGSVLGLAAVPLSLFVSVGRGAVLADLPVLAALIAAATLPLGLVSSFIVSINTGLGEIRSISFGQITGATVSLVVALMLFVTGRLDVVGATAAAFLALVVGLVWNVGIVKRHTARPTVDLQELKSSAGYSSKAYFGSLAEYLNYRQDVILVGYLAGATSVGLYSIAVTFAELMWYIPNSIATALFAKSMASNAEDSAEFTGRTSRVAFALMVVVAVVMALLFRPVVGTLYTPEFVRSHTAYILLIPGALIMGVGKIVSRHLIARGHLYPGASMAATVLNLIANVILIPRFGITGAAVASTVSYSALGLFFMERFRAETGTRTLRMIVPTMADLRSIRTAVADYVGILRRRLG